MKEFWVVPGPQPTSRKRAPFCMQCSTFDRMFLKACINKIESDEAFQPAGKRNLALPLQLTRQTLLSSKNSTGGAYRTETFVGQYDSTKAGFTLALNLPIDLGIIVTKKIRALWWFKIAAIVGGDAGSRLAVLDGFVGLWEGSRVNRGVRGPTLQF